MTKPAQNPIRLMMVTTSHATMGTFFPRQLRLLAENGFEVHTVCSPGQGLERVKPLPGVITHTIPIARNPDPVRDLVSLTQLYGLMRRIRPHIVHAHTPKAGLLGMAAAKAAGVQARLYTIHGLPLLTRQGAWRRLLCMAERTSSAFASQVYSVSPSLQQLVEDMQLCPSGKLTTVGDGSCAGIDLTRFAPHPDLADRAMAIRRANRIPEDAVVLSFAGRVARDKGIAVLAAAWPEIARESGRIHLLIAGEEDATDPVSPSTLSELINHERVHFTRAWVSDVPALYATSSIVVLPTFREGLSQVALEAGAMGVPIVSTRIPGVMSSVRDGVTGLLVPPGEVQPFVEAVRLLIQSPDLRARLGQAAREHIATRFSEQRVNQLWLSEYREWAGKPLQNCVKTARQLRA